jgi:ATPases of the AAA+ class
VRRLRAAHVLVDDPYRGLYIPDAQVDRILNAPRAPGHATFDEQSTNAITRAIEFARSELDERIHATREGGMDLPLFTLGERLRLSRLELGVLLIAAAAEIDLKYETLFGYVQNDVTRKRPTVDLALKLLCDDFEHHLARRVDFAAEAPLLANRLLFLISDPPDRDASLLSRFIKTDLRVVEHLLGRPGLDSRLVPFVQRADCDRSFDELVFPESLRLRLQRASESLLKQPAILLFQGKNGVGRQSAAGAMCARLKLPLLVVDVGQVLASDTPWSTTVALVRREAMLRRSALYFRDFEILLGDDAAAVGKRRQFANAFRTADFPIFLGSERSWHPSICGEDLFLLTLTFPVPIYSERLVLWEHAVNGIANGNGDDLDLGGLANKFTFSAGQIHHAVQTARMSAHLDPEGAHLSRGDLQAAACMESSQPLQKLARKIEMVFSWSDIVLPPRALRQLQEVCLSVKHRPIVYGRWGFEKRLALGRGLNALFAGPSGTGKTMAAQIIARELALDLYQIDLAAIVSKYIGETEKNLNTIFKAARYSNAILFFDEADALFGKRSETKDAHDRYANIEVAYLLQKIEEYEGIVILATNLSNNIDDAFRRRLHHTVEFSFPDAQYRERIWRGAFPSATPLADDIDFGFLAKQFELSGGNIRNIALASAFLAAEEQSAAAPRAKRNRAAVTMEYIVVATGRELQKIGRLPAKADFREYYELIRERV